MNNEIKRKITSLTLMTIMLAGGMSFAVPSMVPAAHAANANLFVSAENSQFSNYMSGPQVIEVVIIDSDINDTDEAKGEPDVTVNGKILRMIQAVDGNWYGYFADKTRAAIADHTATVKSGQGLDFGTLCLPTGTTATLMGITVSDTVGVAIPIASSGGGSLGGSNGSATGTTALVACTAQPGAGANTTVNNVVRESKTLNLSQAGDTAGQIGLGNSDEGAAKLWPFIQLYPLTAGGNVVVQYNKGGGVQTTTLTFDTVDQFIKIDVDRTSYTQGAQVHLTVTDLWLNIDPTDEDSWSFGTNATAVGSGEPSRQTLSTNYQVFSENGIAAGSAVPNGIINISGNLTSLMNPDAVLTMNTDTQGVGTLVTTLQDTDDVEYTTCTTAALCVATGSALSGLEAGTQPITLVEQGPNSGIFGTYDESDDSQIKIATGAKRGTSATLDYDVARTILVANSFATIAIQATDDEWNSGEEIPVVLVDNDANKNSRADEDLTVSNPSTTLIPSLSTGDPFTLGEETNSTSITAIYADVSVASTSLVTAANPVTTTVTVDSFSQIGRIDATATSAFAGTDSIIIDLKTTMGDLRASITNTNANATTRLQGVNLLNLDVSSFNSTGVFDVYLLNATSNVLTGSHTSPTALSGGVGSALIATNVNAKSLTSLNSTEVNYDLFRTVTADSNKIGLLIQHKVSSTVADTTNVVNTADDIDPIVVDFFSFGFTDDGLQANERIANQIVRIEVEETGDNTGTFEGTLEYIMINQLNIKTVATYTALEPISDTPTFIVIEDLTDEDSPRVNYLDLGADGVSTQIADQQSAPSHSGIVSFDSTSYKVADTVTITLEDLDLNVDSELIEIYTTVSTTSDRAFDTIGKSGLPALSWGNLGELLNVTFDDEQWRESATAACVTDLDTIDTGLNDAGFTLVETSPDSGIFTGNFVLPSEYCSVGDSTGSSTTGTDIEVNYQDFRDASGEIIEVGDSAGVRASTGSVSLDRTVYPVPFGTEPDFVDQNTKTTPSGRALFPIHQSGIASGSSTTGLATGEYLANGDLTIHVRVNDPDFNISAVGEDTIGTNATITSGNLVGPVKISVIRGSSTVILGYAGGPVALPGTIDTNNAYLNGTRQFGPITEIAGDAGIFESDIVVRYTDGPASASCPTTTGTFTNIKGTTTTAIVKDRFDAAPTTAGTAYCILQGDILQVEYTDPTDASGNVNTVTDSATFDLRNGVLQSDKSVYIIGSDMILTLIEPDFDLDNDQAETYDLDLIEWDSDAATVTIGNADSVGAKFDPEPSVFRETGDSTGIFQVVIEIPEVIEGTERLERGEEIVLEYTDWGPSGSDFVGDEDEDINLTIFTSNFGATVELDQKVYTWTDKVYITIVAPDHNFDSNLIDEIGESDLDPIKVSTRGAKLDLYRLVETGTDTGIFTGEVILIGFTHDADGDTTTGTNGDDVVSASASGSGPTSGLLPADDDDGLTVSFEFSEDETIIGSALIRWNIGEVQWLEASYPASGTGVVRVIDPDMNLKPEAVDNFNADVWSDSDAGGIDLTVTETNEATGIFEGTVFFTTTDESSGHRLRVAEGDTVTAEYEDNTLPNPYTTADELDISATSLIGTIVPPLERAPAANLRTVDAFGNSLSTVSVDQQVQITADLANGQDREQAFAYLVQIQDDNGVTVSLAWITGSLSAGQSFSPALSWIPTDAGKYTATAFVWESVDNPTALSPPVSTTITVQ
ncbi:MAG: hypothetical protein WD717_06260 [Nitrosarchaeum sp.]